MLVSERTGRVTLYITAQGWEKELTKWFPELVEQATTLPHQVHRCWSRLEMERYLFASRNLTARGDNSQNPGGDFELEGAESRVNSAVRDITMDEGRRISLTEETRAEVERLNQKVDRLMASNLTLLRVIKKLIPEVEQNEMNGEMYQ